MLWVFGMLWKRKQIPKQIMSNNVKGARGVVLPTDIDTSILVQYLMYLNFPEFILFFGLKMKQLMYRDRIVLPGIVLQ
jgi:hypothetical protein